MSEWRVVWVPDPGRWGPLPPDGVLGVRDLSAAVARIGLEPGDPVFVSPDFTVDPGLLDFVRSRDFRGRERETKRNYATDIRLLLTFLSSPGVGWRSATEQDLGDYRAWRCRAPQNPVRVGGSKWNREATAFTKLFRWAGVVPLPVDVSRAEDRAADSVSARVSWLIPRTWGLWSDVGLRGHGRDGAPAWDWDARTEARNTSFVQLMLSSGLRRQEGGSLLTFELPAQRLRHGRYCHGLVAGAVTRSKRDRTFYASVDALGQVEAYVQSERAWAVRRAQQQGRYERLAEIRLVTRVTRGRQAEVHWAGRDGTKGRQRLGRLNVQERGWLFLDGPDGPEPAWLWLSEQGVPLLPDRWNQVFRAANRRCEQVLLTPAEREVGRGLRAAEVRGKVPYATPHSTRHSMALYMLIVLNRLMEARYGLTAAGRRDFALLFGDPWFLVKTLLGHSDVETTKRHYLAPVAHLQLESILAAAGADGPEPDAGDLDGVFARLARETAGIQDIDALAAAGPGGTGERARAPGVAPARRFLGGAAAGRERAGGDGRQQGRAREGVRLRRLARPGPMQRSLAAAFAAQSRRWSGHASADGYWRRLRLFSRFLCGQADPPDDLDGLTVALLKRWRAAHVRTNDGRHAMAVIHALLRQDPRLRSGPVADELARRIPNPRPSGQSYDEAEREQVMPAALAVRGTAWGQPRAAPRRGPRLPGPGRRRPADHGSERRRQRDEPLAAGRLQRRVDVGAAVFEHARGTHESIYVLPNPHVQSASRQVFEDGAREALEQARAAVFGGHLAAGPDPAHQETATADCTDEAASPWPAPGGGCGAGFLLCLGCPNAHVHPGHYPRLAHLHQQVRSLRTALPDHAWAARWHDHLQRLEDLRYKAGASAWNAALARVTSADRTLVSLLLKGILSP